MRDFIKSLSRENQAGIIKAFNSTSRYRDDLSNIDNVYFDQMVDRIHPIELGGLVYRVRKIVGKSNFSEQFRKLII